MFRSRILGWICGSSYQKRPSLQPLQCSELLPPVPQSLQILKPAARYKEEGCPHKWNSEPKKLTILGILPITLCTKCRVISPAPLWAHWQELGGQPFPTNWLIDHQERKTRCNWEFCILRFTVTIAPAWQARPRPGTQLTQKCVGGTSMTKNV